MDLPLSATDLHSAEHGNFVFSQAIGRNVSETVHSPSSTAELYEALYSDHDLLTTLYSFHQGSVP